MNFAELPSQRGLISLFGDSDDDYALAVENYFSHRLRWATSARTYRTKAIRLAMIDDPDATDTDLSGRFGVSRPARSCSYH